VNNLTTFDLQIGRTFVPFVGFCSRSARRVALLTALVLCALSVLRGKKKSPTNAEKLTLPAINFLHAKKLDRNSEPGMNPEQAGTNPE
jgi:hypothetical protein